MYTPDSLRYCLLDLQCPASSVFQYLQCSSTFSVPVSPVFLYPQCSCIPSVPVSPVFLYLQCSCISSVHVSPVFLYLQRRIEVDLAVAPFLVDGRLPADLLTSATSEQSCLKRSPRVEMPFGQECCGYFVASHPRGIPRAQGRAGSAGAIQLESSQRKVAVYDPMPAVP